MSAADEVYVEVRDCLTRMGAVVDGHAEPGLVDTELVGECPCSQEQFAEEWGILFNRGSQSGDDLARDDEDVNRGLRVDVVKCDPVVRLGDHAGRDLAGCDFFEESHVDK